MEQQENEDERVNMVFSKKSVTGLTIAALLAVLSGCSDPKAANTRNFEKAAQAYLDSKYPYCYFTGNFPAEIKQGSLVSSDAEKFSALASVGLLSTRQETIEEAVPSLFSRKEPEIREVEVTIYELTDKGRKYYVEKAKRNWRGEMIGGFCFGKAKLIGVDRYTEPADVGFGLSYVASSVRYRYQVGDFPEWAKDERILAQSRELRRDLASRDEPIIEEYAMILTNEGWIHEKNMD